MNKRIETSLDSNSDSRAPSADLRSATTLRLYADERERLADFANAAYPREACGCLIGERDGADARVRYLLGAKNLAEPGKQDIYELDPVDLKRAEEEARALGLAVIGIWHSHPNTRAVPSKHDRLMAWAGWSYLIASVDTTGVQELSSWRLCENELREETLSD